MFEISENRYTDFLIRFFGLSCFQNDTKMTLIKKNKPKEIQGSKYTYFLEYKDGKTGYVVFDERKEEVREYDNNLKLISKETYDDILKVVVGPNYKERFN